MANTKLEETKTYHAASLVFSSIDSLVNNNKTNWNAKSEICLLRKMALMERRTTIKTKYDECRLGKISEF